ncbi:putative sulfate transporter YchM [Saccharicrinis fermentans DSM 9555 = JCM 21142]|uniref:Putative sulfate transporter YchM n=3 Tax=Saccharicrinis fermentans TaxID=982 RepID=W7YJB7_9BACT|nr:putative sulfate transporter YchM [Saccharicrinis fermentans DSM 9555 = JCM 21142]
MLFFGKWAKLIPMSCLAGILIVVAYNMSEWRSFASILKASWFDIIILITTFLLTVLVDLTVAIEVGVVLSAILFMKRMSDIAEKKIGHGVDTDVIEDYSDIPDGVTIYEISGPLFFGTAKTYTRVIESIGLKHKILIIRMRHVSFVDQTAIHNFKSTIKTLQKSNVLIILSGVNEDVSKTFTKSDIIRKIGENNIFERFEDAVLHAKNKIS